MRRGTPLRAKPISKLEKQHEQNLDLAFEMFCAEAHFSVNKKLVRRYGFEAAGFLSNLLDEVRYLRREGKKLYKHKWFYLTHRNQMANLGIRSEDTIRRLKKIFIKDGILEVKRFGLPAKEYYQFHLLPLLIQLGLVHEDESVVGKSQGLVIGQTQSHSYYYNTYNNNSYKNENREKEKEKDTPIEKKTHSSKTKPSFFTDLISQFPDDWRSNQEFCKAVKEWTRYYAGTNGKRKQRWTLMTCQSNSKKWMKWGLNTTIDYIHHAIEHNWVGIFPSKPNGDQPDQTDPSKPSLSPTSIINAHFARQHPEDWIKTCLNPLMEFIDKSDGSDVAKNLCQLADILRDRQKRPRFMAVPAHGTPECRSYDAWQMIPFPQQIIERYVEWLQDRSWINHRSADLLLFHKGLFPDFFRSYQKDVGFNFFTGESME